MRAYEALGRALQEEPLNGGAGRRSSGSRACWQLATWSRSTRSLVTVRCADPELKNALLHKVALLYEIELGDDEQAAAAYAAALDVSPRDSTRRTRSSSSTCASRRLPEPRRVLLRKAEIVDGLDEKKALCYKAAQI